MLFEPVGGEFPYRLEHGDTGRAVRLLDLADQALVDQTGEFVEHVRRDAVDRIDSSGDRLDAGNVCVREHREQLEQPLFSRLEQLVTPIQRRPERLLPRWQVTRPAAQEPEPVTELFPQRLGREKPQTRRGKLDRQGQSVQPAADFKNRRRIVIGQSEVGTDRLGSVDEQLDGFGACHLLCRDRLGADRGQISGGTG